MRDGNPAPAIHVDPASSTRNMRAGERPSPADRSAARAAPAAAAQGLTVGWARTPQDVADAQRLRFEVFAREMGARLSPLPGLPPGLDGDRFDAFCDHLLVRAPASPGRGHGEVVGTYRVLSPAQAVAAGGYYTDSEFDLAPLAALRPRAVELGRSCVHARWRQGGVIMAMWSALAVYMQERSLDTMIGCASIGLADGAGPALALWQQLRRTHLAEARWQVRPLRGLTPPADTGGAPDSAARALAPAELPPVIKGYLRCGARVLGPPALDSDFNTADLPLMLRLADVTPRYRSHFL